MPKLDHATKPPKPDPELEILRDQIRALGAKIEARLARGTRDDVAAQARAAVASMPPIEALLRAKVASTDEVARVLGLDRDAATKALRADKHVANVGSEMNPRWSWVVGDDGPTDELNALVVRLCEVRPMTFAEIIRYTGAREKRCSGAVVKMQQRPATSSRLLKIGPANKAEWYLPPVR